MKLQRLITSYNAPYGFDVGIGGFDFFPAPDVAVHWCCRSLRTPGRSVCRAAASGCLGIEVFAPESVVDTDDRQVYVGYRLHGDSSKGNAVFRHFVQTGDGRQRTAASMMYSLNFLIIFLLLDRVRMNFDAQRKLARSRILCPVDIARHFGVGSGESGKGQQVLAAGTRVPR